MRCHCCLKESENDFCRSCSQRLFGKANFSALLKFTLPSIGQGTNQNTRRISISGAQAKYSLRIVSKELEPTDNNGTYILKPSTNMQFRLFADMPANEHITMQMAKQIFKLNVAESALLRFTTGEYTYLTKRFDIRNDGSKILQEDLAQTAGLSSDANGSNFKYESLSYEEIADILKLHVSASSIAIEQFFKVLLFNYLVCNGDAHIKNFSIYSPHQDGVYELTGRAMLEDLEELGVNLSSDEVDTIGGYLSMEAGHVPEQGERFTLDGRVFTVLSADRKLIHRLRMEPASDGDAAARTAEEAAAGA